MILGRDIYSRLQGRYRRVLCACFARRAIRIALPHPIISFTFDDFPASALHTGGAILEKNGLSGTFYASLGLASKVGPVGRYFTESDLPQLLARGHELGCHTFDHCHAWLTPPRDYEQSIIRNRDRLKQILPSAEFRSHSYPINYPRPFTKKLTESYFLNARGGGQEPNCGQIDANLLSAFFIEKSRGDPSAIKAQIDRTKATGSWMIFATHDISETPGPFGCTPELFRSIVSYAVEASIVVLPVSTAFGLLRLGGSLGVEP